MSKGYEEFSRKLGTMVQESVSRALNTSKTMLSATSIKEIGELQSEFAKDFFEQWMAGTGRLSEISARVTQEALTPVARQASDTMSKAAQKAQQSSRAA
jgi:phasin family protein